MHKSTNGNFFTTNWSGFSHDWQISRPSIISRFLKKLICDQIYAFQVVQEVSRDEEREQGDGEPYQDVRGWEGVKLEGSRPLTPVPIVKELNWSILDS